MVVVVAQVGVEEMVEEEGSVEAAVVVTQVSVEVAEAGIQASVVVEAGVETSVAVVAAEGVTLGVVETSEVEGAVTVAEVEGVAGVVVLGNREGTWSFLVHFTL